MPGLSVTGLGFLDWGPFDFEVAPGACLGLSGPSGSGKSLLLRALADLDEHRGTVQLDGAACRSMPGPEWRRHVGMLPAEPRWWFDTVGEHLDGLDAALLAAVGFEEDVLGWPVQRLSAGERQRLGLVRLLAREPRALLLDEPTANLDDESVERVEGLIERYRSERAVPVVWVSHDDEQLARCADRGLRFEAKRLHEVAGP